MQQPAIQQKFTAAVEALVDQIKEDRSILAAILCGSLAHDVVWAKSDVDLVLVTIDDSRTKDDDVSLNADGVNIHALLIPRASFRALAEGSLRNSFMHSFLAKGRLLFTHDPTITDLCARLNDIGQRDTELQLLRAATWALMPLAKAQKWFVTRGDLEYAALWILYTATPLAQIEVLCARQLVGREVIQQAIALNPHFFTMIYTDLLNRPKNRAAVQGALDAIEAYLAERAPALFALIIDYLRDAGEPRSSRELEHHFTRHFDVSGVTTACEYLADRGLLEKAGTPVRLTKRSNLDVQELAFFYAGDAHRG